MFQTGENPINKLLTGRVSYFISNATLRILDVRLEDEGRYGCVVLPINEEGMREGEMKNPPTTWTKLVVNGSF